MPGLDNDRLPGIGRDTYGFDQGLRWLRQRPIDHFIVDFYCAELKLVIELDGDSHSTQEGYDNERTKVLAAYGLQVVRFRNEDILNNLRNVSLNLEKISEKRKQDLSSHD